MLMDEHQAGPFFRPFRMREIALDAIPVFLQTARRDSVHGYQPDGRLTARVPNFL
jgi:hypothetical protein